MAEMLGEDRRMNTTKPVGGVDWLKRCYVIYEQVVQVGHGVARVKCSIFTLTAPSHDIDSHYV